MRSKRDPKTTPKSMPKLPEVRTPGIRVPDPTLWTLLQIKRSYLKLFELFELTKHAESPEGAADTL